MHTTLEQEQKQEDLVRGTLKIDEEPEQHERTHSSDRVPPRPPRPDEPDGRRRPDRPSFWRAVLAIVIACLCISAGVLVGGRIVYEELRGPRDG
jgi:hypothetical protein